ncbi:MAG: DUF4421 domain-containing protein [Prevotella sp.]
MLILCSTIAGFAQTDSIVERKLPFTKRVVKALYGFVKEFSQVDTNYVEPQHYNYTLMLQNTNTYEIYRLKNEKGTAIKFAPEPSIKLGPYVGWRWIFLGYTLDLNHLRSDNKKKELDLSLYSSQIGIDLFYRQTGDDYKIRSFYVDGDIDTHPLKNVKYDGLNVSIKGFNLYYIFNHRRFSYPAAFSQSTVQRRSCGSPLIGIGYTKHKLNVDWTKLNDIVASKLGEDVVDEYMNSEQTNAHIRYVDFSVSGGYAYNWVFAHNWLFAASVSMALGYKKTTGDARSNHFSLRDFSVHNFNLDGVGRFGFVWNNTKWYFGANTILHSYNYSKDKFSTNNFFGSVNIYVGFNFDRR